MFSSSFLLPLKHTDRERPNTQFRFRRKSSTIIASVDMRKKILNGWEETGEMY